MLENQSLQKSREISENHQSVEHGPMYINADRAISDFESEVIHAFDHHIVRDERVHQFLENARTLVRHREYQLALNLLRQASNLDSKNPLVLDLLANCLETLGSFEEAAIARRVLSQVRVNFENLHKFATCLYKMGQDERALEQYYEALVHLKEENEFLFETYKNMGNIFVRQGDFDAAEEHYNKAYTLNPNSDVLLVNIGTLQVQRNDFEKSRYCFRRAVEINRNNDKAWVGLAMVHNQLADNELAWANLESALDINPTNRTAVHLYANWGVRDAKTAKSIEVLQDYLSSVEQDEDMSLVLINFFCLTSQFSHAQIEVERVLSWNPDHAEVQRLKKTLHQKNQVAAS
jgi:tetratricopeptide (TPR) repeat protein